MSVSTDKHIAVLKARIDRALLEGVATVNFYKADGTRREMSCTKNVDYIPVDQHPTGARPNGSDLTINVFDVSLQEWRSFRVDKVIDWIDTKGKRHDP